MNILDSLVVTLNLDTTGFKQGVKDATDAAGKMSSGMVDAADTGEKAQSDAAAKIVKALERIADQGDRLASENERQNKKIKDSTDRSSESIVALGRKFLSLYVLLTAGQGVKSFVADVTAADAALGRTAKNLDTSSRNLSAWQNAAVVAGGSAEGITGTLKGLTSEMQKAALTGQSSIIPAARALGINLADAKGHARDATEVLKDLADRFENLDPARATELGHMMGIDDGTINLLERGRAAVEALLREEQKYAATAEDIDAAQKRQSGWRQLLITSSSLGRTILTALTPALTAAMTGVQRWADANQDFIKTKVVEYAERFAKWVQGVDWAKVSADVGTFATGVGTLASALASVAADVGGDGTLYKGLEALGALAGVTLVAKFADLVKAVGSLSAVELPAWFVSMAGLGGIAATAPIVQGQHILEPPKAGEDPVRDAVEFYDPARLWGGDAKGQRDRAAAGDTRTWWQRVAPKFLGGQDDPKTRDAIADTAKATGEIRDLMKAQKDGLGQGGTVNVGGGANLGSGAPNLRYGRRGGGSSGAFRGTPVPDAPYNGKNIDGLTEAQSKQYAAILGNRESGNRYGTTNPYGYVGRWQFGASALAENGYVRPGTTNAGLNDPNNWTGKGGVHSVEEWKANKGGVQDQALGEYTNRHYAQLKAAGVIRDGMSPAEVAGWLAAAHLKGIGGAIALSRGRDNVDANGTSASSYRRMMEGVGKGEGASAAATQAPTAPAPIPTTQAPVPAGTPPAAIGDAAALAAERRLKAGGSDPKDRALLDRYRAQQNTPKAEHPAVARGPAQPTLGHAVRSALHVMAHANRLTHHNDNHPVPVTDAGAMKLQERTFGAFAKWGARHPDQLDRARALAHGKAASLARMTRLAAASGGGVVHHTVNHVDTRIGEMNVHPKGDGRQFAGEFHGLVSDRARRGDVVQANGALA